jgi:hypothetical protein
LQMVRGDQAAPKQSLVELLLAEPRASA